MALEPQVFQSLFRAGRYAEILKNDDSSVDAVRRIPDAARQMSLAQVLIHADRIADAREIIAFNLERSDKAIIAYCELLLGLIAKRETTPDIAIRHFQSAIRLAREASASKTVVWGHLHLFRVLAEIASPQELSALLAEARRLVTNAGDPHLASYLHESVALREAQVGRVLEARRHLEIAGSILEHHPNAWIQQLMHMSAACVACLDCDFRLALNEIRKARELRHITGSSYQDPIIDANEAHFQLFTGRLAFALPTMRRLSNHHRALIRIGALDGIACLHLSLNQLEECNDAIHEVMACRDAYTNHNSRWTAWAQLSLLLRMNEVAEATRQIASELQHARQIADVPLTIALLLLEAEALARNGDFRKSGLCLLEASQLGAVRFRDKRGDYYETCHQVLLAAGEQKVAVSYRVRAIKLWRAQGNLSAQLTALSRDTSVLDMRNYSQSAIDRMSDTALETVDQCEPVRDTFLLTDAIAAAFDAAESPDLAATELRTVSTILGCQSLLEFRHAVGGRASGENGLISVARRSQPSDPMQSATVANLLRIAEAIAAVARARADDRARAALWPADEPLSNDSLFFSDEMTALAATARKIAPTPVPVLITGETGTGKEVLARAIHAASTRAKATFLPFNCSAGPRDMIDAQLFGHRRGAFTGATENAPGVVRAAAGGTLFLDEIGEAPLDVQPKLLRFLESGEIHPVGEPQPTKVDVRIIAATNIDLDAAVSAGRFREDLFYRLNIIRLHLPPLRERRVEIPAFAQHYLRKHARELGKGDLRLAEETMEYLLLFRWPGNVRQLANEMRRLAVLAETDAVLMPEHLSSEIVASRRTVPASERTLDGNELVVRLDQPLAAATEHLERAIIPYALKQCGGRVEDAARMLGLSRKGLYLKRLRLRLEMPEQQARTA